ncbi:MAG: thioredoxin family protein [Vicinamibacterales bacterium]
MTRHSVLAGLIVVFALALPGSTSAQTPPAASDVVATAVAKAKAENKAVLIEFGASWCTWCRNFEAFVKSPDAGPILAEHFVIVNLTVRERDDKKVLEHPGGNGLMDGWGGAMSGLPFYVFLNGAGGKVADSNAMPDGTNIGFPAVPDEIRAFIALMDKAVPALPAVHRDTLQSYLVRVMPKAN